MQTRRLRVFFERVLELDNGRRIFLTFFEGLPHHLIIAIGVWSQPRHLAIDFEHQLVVKTSQTVEHFDIVREDLLRSLQDLQRLLVLAYLNIAATQIDVGLAELGVE